LTSLGSTDRRLKEDGLSIEKAKKRERFRLFLLLDVPGGRQQEMPDHPSGLALCDSPAVRYNSFLREVRFLAPE
jgi:hypothetical protein